MTLLLEASNNATGSLDAGINDAAVTLDVKAGEGALFPDIGDAVEADYFYVTLQKDTGAWEIVKVTQRSTDAFTITRNIDSSTGSAMAFDADDIVSCRPVADIILDIVTELNLMNPSGTLTAPATTAMIFYQAAAPTGWTIVGAVADCLIGIKGGSDGYDDVAGTLVGSWTPTGHTHGDAHTHELDHTHDVDIGAHKHQWLDYVSKGTIKTWNTAGVLVDVTAAMTAGSTTQGIMAEVTDANAKNSTVDFFTSEDSDTETSEQPDDATTDSQSAVVTDSDSEPITDRPYAALSIMCDKD